MIMDVPKERTIRERIRLIKNSLQAEQDCSHPAYLRIYSGLVELLWSVLSCLSNNPRLISLSPMVCRYVDLQLFSARFSVHHPKPTTSRYYGGHGTSYSMN